MIEFKNFKLPKFTASQATLNFTILEKQICHVKGKSGSGKTTFFNCIAGIERNFTGEILFKTFKPETAYMPQNVDWNEFSISELYSISEFFDEIEFKENLHYLNIASVLKDEKKPLATLYLSGGQAQRLTLSFILSFKKKELFLFDEPLSALDASYSILAMELIKDRIINDDCCAFIISHAEIPKVFMELEIVI